MSILFLILKIIGILILIPIVLLLILLIFPICYQPAGNDRDSAFRADTPYHLGHKPGQNFYDIRMYGFRLPADIIEGHGINGKKTHHGKEITFLSLSDESRFCGYNAVGIRGIADKGNGDFLSGQPGYQIQMYDYRFPRILQPLHNS